MATWGDKVILLSVHAWTSTCHYGLITLGVEKNNDTSKRNYFSDKHNAPGEIIRSDYCLKELQHGVWGHPSWVWVKRPYTKRKQYWKGGRIQAVRKCQQTESDTSPESWILQSCIGSLDIVFFVHVTSSFESWTLYTLPSSMVWVSKIVTHYCVIEFCMYNVQYMLKYPVPL